MILLAKELHIGNSPYVYAFLKNGTTLKQPGTLQGYTGTTFAVDREDCTYVYDENNQLIFSYPLKENHAEDDLNLLLEVNR